MRELNIGGVGPLSEGIDTREFGMDHVAIAKHAEQELSAKLEYRRAHWIGTFDTELPCACGQTIMDHAVTKDPNHRVSANEIRFGPQPPLREQLERFKPYHCYWCDDCGLTYKETVIEGVRGYVPREKRAEFAG